MKLHRLWVFFCLATAAAQADPAHTIQVLQANQIIASAQSSNGVGTVVAGPNFNSIDAQSLPVFCGTFLTYLQSLDPTVQQFTLVDGSGNLIGTYSNGTLSLSGQ